MLLFSKLFNCNTYYCLTLSGTKLASTALGLLVPAINFWPTYVQKIQSYKKLTNIM